METMEHIVTSDLPKVKNGHVAVIGFLFVAMMAALFLSRWLPRQKAEAQLVAEARQVRDARPMVEIARPHRSTAASDLVLPGDVRSMQDTAIYPRANGYLKRLLVDIGDHVEAGQLLAEIDAPEVDAELNQAKAALEQAKANAAKAETDEDLAQRTLKRFEELAQKDLVPPQQIDEKRSAYNQAHSTFVAAKASIASAQAAIERLTSLQNFEKVVAPFTGTITARNYDVGALLSASNAGPGREMFRIDQTDTLRVFVNVPQAYATSIRVGQSADLDVRNYPGRRFTGTVTRSAGAIDSTTRTLRFEVDFPNRDHALYPGMWGRVKFAISHEDAPLTVPTSALVYGSDGTQVALVQDGKVHFRKIAVGRDFGTEVEVAEGLKGGEQVVANPDERLAEGVDVQVNTATTNAAPVRGSEPRADAR